MLSMLDLPGGGSPLYNLMEVKYQRIARAMAARLGLKEAMSKSRGLMYKNRMKAGLGGRVG